MNTPNIHFEGTPIEYKKISPEDFDSRLYNVTLHEAIEPNKEGYISEKLLPILTKDLQNRNTTVINAGVGQGKTRAIIEIISKYASNSDYIVIIAVPYKSLIKQYVKDCQKYLSKGKIFDLLDYEERKKKGINTSGNWGYTNDELVIPISSELMKYKVHIMTINALLGNPSDDNLFTSKNRSDYFNALKEYCNNSNKKLVWLFDEIHDSIHNFKEQFIFNLWGYYGLVHKAFVVSATFNEASKEVIKYISEFTDKNISIIESNRSPRPSKQSNLHLNFYVDHQLDRDVNLVKLVSKLVNTKKSFDILVYSKSLAEKLINPNKTSNSRVKKVSDILKYHNDKINRCYSDVFNPRANKKYSNNKGVINIGTNFSTGINIEEDNHTFIILFPKDLSVEYVNNKGVFTNGSNVIIQALARQRKKGNIFIFLPNPQGISKESLPYDDNLKEVMNDSFENYKGGSDKKVDYTSINNQGKLLSKAYNKLEYDTKVAKENLKPVDRKGLNRLLYPTKDIFILNQGEKYITKEFFGGNLPAYILWASISNQFLNCNLKSINASNRLNFDKENLFLEIIKLVNITIDEYNDIYEEFNLYDSYSYYEKLGFAENLFLNNSFYINDKKATSTEKKRIFLMILITIFKDAEEFDLKSSKSELQKLYLRSCIYHSNNLQEITDNIETRDLACVRIFKKWHQLLDVIDDSKIKVKGKLGLHINPNSDFEELFKRMNFTEDLKYLLNNEFLIGTDVFQFKNTITTAINKKTLVDTFYKTTIKLFYSSKSGQTSKYGDKVSYYKVEKLDLRYIPNFLHQPLPEVIL